MAESSFITITEPPKSIENQPGNQEKYKLLFWEGQVQTTDQRTMLLLLANLGLDKYLAKDSDSIMIQSIKI